MHDLSTYYVGFLSKISEIWPFPLLLMLLPNLTKPPSYLAWVSTDKFLTDIPSSTFPQPYPHAVYSPHSSSWNSLKTYVRSHPLLKFHNYFPLTQTESQSSYINLLAPSLPDPSLRHHLPLFSFLLICLKYTGLPSCCSLDMANILL